MTKDLNKEIDSIYYNHLNLTDKVVFATGDSILYFYDAAGIKLRQEVYKAGTLKMKRDYAGEFYYENDTLKFIHHEEGRVVIQNDELAYEYHLRDHLGNNRLTFSTKPETYTIVATMEDSNSETEEAYFENVAETRVSMAAANHTLNGSKAARVQSTDPIGPMTMLSVNKGDTVTFSAYAYYEGDGSTDGLISESALLAALLSSYSGASGISEVSSQTQAAIENGLDFPNNLLPKTNEANDDAPKAYLNYMQFDADMNLVTSGFKQITTAAQGMKEYVETTPLTIDQNGYVLVYVSNESDELNWVHFDDFTVTHSKTPIVQVDDYYPFGGAFNSFTRNYSEPQKYKFGGKEEQEEWGVYDFEARMYDPWIGRFSSVDPLSETQLQWNPYHYVYNNPIAFIDPTGMFGDYFTKSGEHIGNDGIDDDKVYIADKTTGTIHENGKTTTYDTWENAEEIGTRSDFLDMNGYEVTSTETQNNLIGLSINMKTEGVTEDYATISVTSGDRDGASNAGASGATGSRHLFGDAADIAVAGMTNKDLAKAANASGLFSSVIYYPDYGDTGNFGSHDVKSIGADGKEVVTQELNFQSNGPHVHVDNGPTKKSPLEYTGHKSSATNSGTYKKLK